MTVLNVMLGFLAGLVLVFTATLLFKIKMRTEARLICNSLLGIAALLALNLFHIAAVPINLFNAFLTGFLGLPAIILIYIVIHI